jgi:uncharacterized protein YegP (UPF0339 family)
MTGGSLGYRVSAIPNLRPMAALTERCLRGRRSHPEPEGDNAWPPSSNHQDNAGEFRFHWKDPNGQIIAASQGYETTANAEKGIEAIKTRASGAKVEDHSGT